MTVVVASKEVVYGKEINPPPLLGLKNLLTNAYEESLSLYKGNALLLKLAVFCFRWDVTSGFHKNVDNIVKYVILFVIDLGSIYRLHWVIPH